MMHHLDQVQGKMLMIKVQLIHGLMQTMKMLKRMDQMLIIRVPQLEMILGLSKTMLLKETHGLLIQILCQIILGQQVTHLLIIMRILGLRIIQDK